ncbi:hypothetical protein [Mesorhizobium sp. M0768]|uniref:hypothetical protein n=1 Tax=Mesorhizobium sp. M0768 TaxID=2956996 RepID=UPI00333C8FE9
MEVLSARNRKEKGLSSLWVTLKDWPWSADHLGIGAAPTLNLFRDSLDARSGDTPAIPRIADEPWKFTTRQLRRTVAWYIANRPFGTVADKIQYKHASIAIFEGYAAQGRPTSASPSSVSAHSASSTISSSITRRFFAMRVRLDRVPRGCGASSPMCRTSLAIFPAG